jgi:hypothetical protein
MTSLMNNIKSMIKNLTNNNNTETPSTTPENYENYENCNNCQNCQNCLNYENIENYENRNNCQDYENIENFVENFNAEEAEKRTNLEYVFFLLLIIATSVYLFSPKTFDMDNLKLDNLKKSTPKMVMAIFSLLFLLMMGFLSLYYKSTSIISLCLIAILIIIRNATMKGVSVSLGGEKVVDVPAVATGQFNFF